MNRKVKREKDLLLLSFRNRIQLKRRFKVRKECLWLFLADQDEQKRKKKKKIQDKKTK
mgnify:CR=1 FL=1